MTIPVTVDWQDITATSRTTLTTHLWTAPPLRRGSPIHDATFDAVRELRADLVRFLPWFSHPRLSVAELHPPTDTETFWDFELLDPFVEDFMSAAEGRPVVANFATIPAWMFTEQVPVPEDPNEIVWGYEQGNELRDSTCTEVADYFYRLASWYIAGGFHDELGTWHESGHRYRFAYWEVLCEPDLRGLSPQQYQRLYDAVVQRLRPLDPEMKFVGLSLTHQHGDPEYFWTFLDPANHSGGAPDAFSYHFYAHPETVDPYTVEAGPPLAHWRDRFFAQADGFLDQVRLIDSIRRRIAPDTKTFINEVGTFTADTLNLQPDIPQEYWALSASVQSYLWAKLLAMGIDLVGIAEFVGYPGMVPGVTLLDWDSAAPNARYHALKLLLRNFAPGDALVRTDVGDPAIPEYRVHVQGFLTRDGSRKLLIINKTREHLEVIVAPDDASVALAPYAVEVLQVRDDDLARLPA